MNDDLIKKLTKQEACNICQNASDGKVVEGLFVGREHETQAILNRIKNATNGTGSAVFIVGENGKGKSKFVNHITSIARDELNNVISVFEIKNERFSGTGARELYSRFINNLSLRTKPDGAALETLLQNFIMKVQEDMEDMDSAKSLIEQCSEVVLKSTEGAEINTAFAQVISLYINAVTSRNKTLRDYTLKWLRGEYQRVQDVHTDFGHGVDIIINDRNAIAMIKNWIRLFSYLGMTTIMAVDEIQRLAKLDEAVARRNWDVIKDLYDDSRKLKVVFLFTGTTELIDRNNKRGLFSNPDLSSRLGGKKFNNEGLTDFSQSIIYLSSINNPYELLEYLSCLKRIKEIAIGRELQVSESDLQNFLSKVKKEKEIYDPKQGPSENKVNVPIRDIMKDFMRILALMEYYPEKSFSELCGFNSQMPQAGETNINNDQIEVL